MAASKPTFPLSEVEDTLSHLTNIPSLGCVQPWLLGTLTLSRLLCLLENELTPFPHSRFSDRLLIQLFQAVMLSATVRDSEYRLTLSFG